MKIVYYNLSLITFRPVDAHSQTDTERNERLHVACKNCLIFKCKISIKIRLERDKEKNRREMRMEETLDKLGEELKEGEINRWCRKVCIQKRE